MSQEIEDIIHSLDGIKKAAAPDFFYTRLQGRMQQGLHAEKKWQWLPVAYVSAFLLFLVMNVWMLVQANTTSNAAAKNTTSPKQQHAPTKGNIQDFATAFSMD